MKNTKANILKVLKAIYKVNVSLADHYESKEEAKIEETYRMKAYVIKSIIWLFEDKNYFNINANNLKDYMK